MAKKNRGDDPIENYIEWSEHRYDPGYYLGGNIAPHLRKASLGPRARRMAGLFLGVTAITTLLTGVLSLSVDADPWAGGGWIGYVVLTGAAAVAMYRSAARVNKAGPTPRRRRNRDGGENAVSRTVDEPN